MLRVIYLALDILQLFTQYIINCLNIFKMPSTKNITPKTPVLRQKHYAKCDTVRICQCLQPTYLISETHTCENQIIRASIKTLGYKICHVSPFKIEYLTYLTLKNNQGYILIPESDLSLNINCPSESKDIVLKEATLIRTDEDCILNSESVIIKLSKTVKLAKHTSYRIKILLSLFHRTN